MQVSLPHGKWRHRTDRYAARTVSRRVRTYTSNHITQLRILSKEPQRCVGAMADYW